MTKSEGGKVKIKPNVESVDFVESMDSEDSVDLT